jgi:hypothetical protein
MSVEEQRAYVAAVDHMKQVILATTDDMVSVHQQLKQAAFHGALLTIQSGIDVLLKHATILRGARDLIPPTPKLVSDFEEPVPYPRDVTETPETDPMEKTNHLLKEAGVEDLSTPVKEKPVYVREPVDKRKGRM